MTCSGQSLGFGLVEEHIHVVVADLADKHERSRDLGSLKGGRYIIGGLSDRGRQVESDLSIVGDLVAISNHELLASLADS